MSSWREGYNRAVLAWLSRYLAERRPYGDWGVPAEIVDISERIDKGFGGSDVTAGDDPTIELTVVWKNTEGIRHAISEDMTFTQLMKELTP